MQHPRSSAHSQPHRQRKHPPRRSRAVRATRLQAQRGGNGHQHGEDGAADAGGDLVALALAGGRVALAEAGAGAGGGGGAGGLGAGAGAVVAAVAHGADAGLAGHRLGRAGGLGRAAAAAGAEPRVVAVRLQAAQHHDVVRFFDRVVRGRDVRVDVRLGALDVGAGWRVVALHRHVVEHGVVVPVLHVRAVPVDQSARPLHRARRVRGETCGPQRELDARWSLRVEPAVGRGIPGFVTVKRSENSAVDGPGQRIRCPIDGVGMNCG